MAANAERHAAIRGSPAGAPPSRSARARASAARRIARERASEGPFATPSATRTSARYAGMRARGRRRRPGAPSREPVGHLRRGQVAAAEHRRDALAGEAPGMLRDRREPGRAGRLEHEAERAGARRASPRRAQRRRRAGPPRRRRACRRRPPGSARGRRCRRRSCPRARSTISPRSKDSAIAGAPSAQTATTRVAGARSATTRAMPPSIAPLPSGTTSASSGCGRASSSRAIVPAPSEIAGSRPSSTIRAPVSTACARAASFAASKSSPVIRTSAPSARIRSILNGFAWTLVKTVGVGAVGAAGVGEGLAEVARARADEPGAGRERRADEPVGAAALERADRVERLDLHDELAAERGLERLRAELRRAQEDRVDRGGRLGDAGAGEPGDATPAS